MIHTQTDIPQWCVWPSLPAVFSDNHIIPERRREARESGDARSAKQFSAPSFPS